jgi:hypothetical protein
MQLTNPLNKTNKVALTILVILIMSPLSATAQIYKSVDADGKVTFTDQPDGNTKSEAVEISTPNTLPAVAAPATPRTKPVSGNNYSSVAITSPTNNSIIANGLLPFTVTANTQPSLQEGHTLQLKINGEIHSTSTGSMPRGEHQFQVLVIDEDKQVLKQSAPVKVFVYRPGK